MPPTSLEAAGTARPSGRLGRRPRRGDSPRRPPARPAGVRARACAEPAERRRPRGEAGRRTGFCRARRNGEQGPQTLCPHCLQWCRGFNTVKAAAHTTHAGALGAHWPPAATAGTCWARILPPSPRGRQAPIAAPPSTEHRFGNVAGSADGNCCDDADASEVPRVTRGCTAAATAWASKPQRCAWGGCGCSTTRRPGADRAAGDPSSWLAKSVADNGATSPLLATPTSV